MPSYATDYDLAVQIQRIHIFKNSFLRTLMCDEKWRTGRLIAEFGPHRNWYDGFYLGTLSNLTDLTYMGWVTVRCQECARRYDLLGPEDY